MRLPSQTPLFLLFGDKLSDRHVRSDRTVTRNVAITHPYGLHVRPCHALSQLARRYRAQIEIRVRRSTDDVPVADARDARSLMLLGVRHGETVRVSALGPHADEALDAVVALLSALPELFPREDIR